jgi:FkbM family methyltransferase
VNTAIKKLLDATSNRLGIAITRKKADPLGGLVDLINRLETELVIDVGANAGQYALALRSHGYGGRIESFEPVAAPYAAAVAVASSDALWNVHNYALGSTEGTAQIHVAGNAAASSSLLPMLSRHERSAPLSHYVAEEKIRVRPLAGIAKELNLVEGVFLKIDTQGFEREVLTGCGDLIPDGVVGVQLELSLLPLYESGPLAGELINWMAERQLVVEYAASGFTDQQTGELLQFDAVFVHERFQRSRESSVSARG